MTLVGRVSCSRWTEESRPTQWRNTHSSFWFKRKNGGPFRRNGRRRTSDQTRDQTEQPNRCEPRRTYGRDRRSVRRPRHWCSSPKNDQALQMADRWNARLQTSRANTSRNFKTTATPPSTIYPYFKAAPDPVVEEDCR